MRLAEEIIVDVGIGSVAIAVNCCDAGYDYFVRGLSKRKIERLRHLGVPQKTDSVNAVTVNRERQAEKQRNDK